ncbi:hypothetical protein SAMN06298216_4377 [Spirosomataceae bacterium TFI 002]|nr:hypothetical protein SAMN06298216_4377 [Spirosomataceae bacterium TFI 002]
MDKVSDLLEYFNFESDKGLFLIHVLCNCGFAYFIFTSLLDGRVDFPDKVSLKDGFDFFSSFQFIIPIILYLVVRLTFSTLFPIIIGIIPRGLFELWYQKKFHENLKNSVQKADKNDAEVFLARLNQLRERLGTSKLTMSEAENRVFNKEEIKEREEIYYARMMTMTVLFQLFCLYLIQTNSIFQSKWIGTFLILIFILLYLRLCFTMVINRCLDVVKNILEKKRAEDRVIKDV